MQQIRARLDASRKELLDLGLRNPLLSYRPSTARGVQIIQESPASVYDILVQQGKAMTFKAAEEKKAQKEGEVEEELVNAEKEETQWDTKLQTAETDARLQEKLLNTYYAARTSIEEQGVNILYIALGMLNWFESESSEEVRKAPLILIPVTLERFTARERFKLRYTGEEVGENLSLQAKMRAEFGIAIPDLPESDAFSISDFFDEVEKAINQHKRWQVDRNAVELGFFSFGKFMIYNDLDNDNWPQDAQPIAHPVLLSLFGNGFADPPPTVAEDAFIDDETDANNLYQVVDADSSQLLAMLAVHEGRNLVIQGPPGTGKSQTITNIIANAIGQGKKVLFVAEKLAALEVVKRRLDAIHLGEACLELHSHKGSKKELHAELMRVLELGKPALQHLQQQVALLDRHRQELNDYSKAVNTEIQNSGYTVQQLIGLLLQLQKHTAGTELPRFSLPQIQEWDGVKAAAAFSLVDKMQALLQNIGVPAEAIYWGSGLKVLLPHEGENLLSALQSALAATKKLTAAAANIAAFMLLPPPQNREGCLLLAAWVELAAAQPPLFHFNIQHEAWTTAPEKIRQLLQSGERLSHLQQQYDAIFLPEAWGQEVLPLRGELLAHGHKWYRFLIPSFNKAQKQLQSLCKQPLPKDNTERLQYIDAILEAKRLKILLQEQQSFADASFGKTWQQQQDWSAMTAAADYLLNLYKAIAEEKVPKAFLNFLATGLQPQQSKENHQLLMLCLQEHGKRVQEVAEKLMLNEALLFKGATLLHQPFQQQLHLLQNWSAELPQIHHIIAWNNLAEASAAEGLQSVAERAAYWPHASLFLKAALQKTWYEHLLQTAFNQYPALRKFERATHEEVVAQFAKGDELNLQYNRARAALQHWEGVPKGEAGGQVNILRTEFNKKARHLPIRKLMAAAGLAVQAIKPVFMMSPLSIANFLPPGALEFDLVIFDEASQVRPVEALGAILRGKQLVVVGDTRQLPPTSFFDTLTSDLEDEENVTADLPSILGMCHAQGAPQRMLRWHYRSRHQSLITFSNYHFYENKLVVFPSPGSSHKAGLFFHHLKDTSYDRGHTRTNAQEAEAVVNAVMEHARLHPKLSLGVVAFSTAQRQAIQDALELKRRQNGQLEPFFSTAKPEPFFVKNLENVQGDERDVIFISIGYGRTAEGYVSMNFGPLNNEGGEKRLNVLITRAKLRCEVFTNICSDDIDTSRTKSAGVIALKSFLHYAQHGRLEVQQVTGLPAQSPFEESVATELTAMGYRVQRQVGSKGFFIDLAIEDPEQPGRFILGIECDGATYHAAHSARDRDRLRQQVLEAIGWKIYRIWSTDWFRNKEQEMQRLIAAIDAAWKGGLHAEPADEEVVTETSLLREAAEDHNSLPPYTIAQLPAQMRSMEMHQQPVSKLAHWVELVVQTESPVHFDEVARRMVEAAGITRVGPRIREHLKLAARFAEGSGRVQQKEEFLWWAGMQMPPLRNRSNLPPASRKLKYIAVEELAGVIEKVVRNAVAIHPEAAFPYVARLLGFTRVTEDMRGEILAHIEKAVQCGIIQQEGGLLMVAASNQKA